MVKEKSKTIIRPQEGYQMNVLASSADIVVSGAMAGVGKTFALLCDPLKHVTKVPGFGAVIFRRTTPQIRSEGGLWDTSQEIYPFAGGQPKESVLEWTFNHGNKIKFAHLEYEKNKLDWQGSQIAFIGFDELTHFSENQFFYLLSRNRSTCGVRPYVRATCNPDPDSWVANLISWWIDQNTGFPIKEREGVLRYFIKRGGEYVWGDSYEEILEKSRHFLEPILEAAKERGAKMTVKNFIKSLTFISGSIYDNHALLSKDPDYLGNLMAQEEPDRVRLMEGSWRYVDSDTDIYPHSDFAAMFNEDYKVANPGDKRICADIAMQGRDKMVVAYFEGRSLEDIEVIDKSSGDEVIAAIKRMANVYRVPASRILYDAHGVGSFVDGFIRGAIPFLGGGRVIETWDMISGTKIKENYQNLKTQMFYRSGAAVSKGLYKINKRIHDRRYDEKFTIKERFLRERKAIKKFRIDSDGKKKINTKEDQRIILGGDSPDLMDVFSMNEYFSTINMPRPFVRRVSKVSF